PRVLDRRPRRRAGRPGRRMDLVSTVHRKAVHHENVKEAVRRTVREHADSLIELSHRLHAHPETAFEEHRAAAWLAETLGAAGFRVETGVGGLATAFTATTGTGGVTVALCAEYDALPGLG